MTKGDQLTIAGTDFNAVTAAVNEVKIGAEAECVVTSSTTTSLTCVVGDAPAGSYDVSVLVTDSGRARIDSGSITITYTASVGDIQPRTSKLGGRASCTRSLFPRRHRIFLRPCKRASRFPRRPFTRRVFLVEELACQFFDEDLVTRKNRQIVAIYTTSFPR